jgi:small-conductance mechanosensitive channel
VSEILTGLHDILAVKLFTLGGTPVHVATVVTALGIILVAFWVSSAVQGGTRRYLTMRGVKDEGSIGVTTRLVHYLVMAAGLGLALDMVGVNLATLFAAGAFLAVAIGFAMQNILQNFVSGLILLVEHTIKPGDVIEVENRMVRVTKLGIRATVGRTLDDEDIIMPNSTLVQGTVKNYTLRDRLYRIRSTVGVAYSSDLDLVHRTLQGAVDAIDWRETTHDPRVLLIGFGSSSVDFDVSIWIEDPFGMSQALSRLNFIVWDALRDAGVSIAFPQMDVHLDPSVEAALGRRSAE